MVREKFKPDQGTLAVVISVCAVLVALGGGRMVNLYVIRAGYEHEALVMSSLISMYSRCGLIDDSALVFECMVKGDTVSWDAMIAAYACYGFAVEAFKLFNTMLKTAFTRTRLHFWASC
nr:pentatricopeptide repeat protein AaPPR773 [Agave angustifolia]UPT48771.1 pentatricopeptide repeat protein AaPPR776 [Agave angustifolia]